MLNPIATLRRRVSGQEGFSLIEVTVALGVLFLSLLALARTATVAFTDVSFGRQRTGGNQLANQLLEEIRALPYDTLTKGLRTSDLAGDGSIVNCSGTYRYVNCSGEKIVHSVDQATVSPLNPHRDTIVQNGSTFAWRTYVTEATDAPSKGAYRVTVVVDWNPTSRGGARTEVNLQTLIFSPEGCIDTATHPFGAPCQSYFYSTGSVGGGSYDVTGEFDDGVVFDSMTGTLLSETADIQFEQLARVEGDVVLPHIATKVAGVETVKSIGVSSAADTDPATATDDYLAESLTPQAADSLTISDSEYATTLALGGGDSGSTISTTAAGGANSCNLQIDGLPCGYASGLEAGTLTHTLNVLGPGQATLLSVGTSSSPVTVYTRRYKPVAAEVGLVRETVSWNLPEIRIGGIPPGVPSPSGWAGYWVRLTGFTATATAESGVSTAAPSVSITGGTVQAWNGNGYTSTAVTAAGGAIAIDEVDEGTNGSTKRDIDIEGTVTVNPSTTTEVVSGATRTDATATIGSPLVVEMSYVVENDQPGNTNDRRAELDVVFSAGTAVLTTQYKA